MIGDRTGSAQESPQAYPPTQNTRAKRRHSFSQGVFGLESHHIGFEKNGGRAFRSAFRQGAFDDPLHVLDDLTNRSVDPLFADHSLVRKKRSRSYRVTTFVVTLLLCIAVGMAATSVVKTLHQDSRLNVRLALAKQLTQSGKSRTQLQGDIAKINGQIKTESKKLDNIPPLTKQQQNETILDGTSSVIGRGVVVTLTPGGQTGDGINPRDITDTELQELIQTLWANGAEAIAVNSTRIGPMTTIRIAGSSLLIGFDAISPPYMIQAIGDAAALQGGFSAARPQQVLDNLEKVGISASYEDNNHITLVASDEMAPRSCSDDTTKVLCYAQRITAGEVK